MSAPAICQTSALILDPKTAFDASGLELSECVQKVYLNVTHDVKGWVKGDFFLLSVIAGFAGQCSHIKLKLSRWNGMSSVWDAFKTPPKFFVTLY